MNVLVAVEVELEVEVELGKQGKWIGMKNKSCMGIKKKPQQDVFTST